MASRRRVKTENLKPFKKGSDSRRNMNGAMCAERATWSAKFNNALAKKLDPEEAAEILVGSFRRKQPWAVQEVLDRLVGKPSQPVEHSGKVDASVHFIYGNGNGESK